MAGSRLTNRNSNKTEQNENLLSNDIQNQLENLRKTLANSIGLFAATELARQTLYDTTIPKTCQINCLQWIAQFSLLNGKNGQAERFVK